MRKFKFQVQIDTMVDADILGAVIEKFVSPAINLSPYPVLDDTEGKIQLIDATSIKSPLRKNLGQKNCELTPELREQIIKLYLDFEDNEYSKIFDNSAFGYWKATVPRLLYGDDGKPLTDKKGKPAPDKEKTDTEQIPLDYPGGVDAFITAEVLPYAPDAWVDGSKTQIGYEISFTKHFYKPVKLRELSEIIADIRALEKETEGLLDEVLRI